MQKIIAILLLINIQNNIYGQLGKGLLNNIKNKVNQKINQKVDEKIDKTINDITTVKTDSKKTETANTKPQNNETEILKKPNTNTTTKIKTPNNVATPSNSATTPTITHVTTNNPLPFINNKIILINEKYSDAGFLFGIDTSSKIVKVGEAILVALPTNKILVKIYLKANDTKANAELQFKAMLVLWINRYNINSAKVYYYTPTKIINTTYRQIEIIKVSENFKDEDASKF